MRQIYGIWIKIKGQDLKKKKSPSNFLTIAGDLDPGFGTRKHLPTNACARYVMPFKVNVFAAFFELKEQKKEGKKKGRVAVDCYN
jgi:hypothetical protein